MPAPPLKNLPPGKMGAPGPIRPLANLSLCLFRPICSTDQLPEEVRVAGLQIGELLVEQGVLSPKQVQHILEIQQVSHRPFGDLAERLYGVSPEAVEDAWVNQYLRLAGVIDLEEQEIDVACLRIINRRQAWQFHVLPTQRTSQNLQVATDAEHLVRAVNFAARKIGEPVCFLIAERQQLRDFLMKHYPVPEHMAAFAETL
jgi:hypothetical protein